MQAAAPEAVDLTQRDRRRRKKLYGMDEHETAAFGTNCLLARRLVERGVRFVQLYSRRRQRLGRPQRTSKRTTRKLCTASDKPIAGLLTDLKARGLLEDTLVVWGGEFGRTPFNEKGDGRDHNPWGFTMWMAGGGVKGGQVIGTTDEIGLHAREQRVHVHDIHATMLWVLGLDHLARSPSSTTAAPSAPPSWAEK